MRFLNFLAVVERTFTHLLLVLLTLSEKITTAGNVILEWLMESNHGIAVYTAILKLSVSIALHQK